VTSARPRTAVGGATLERVGAAIAPLLLTPSRWIYRRVETVRFIDDSWVRRHVSVDFELPPLLTETTPYRMGSPPSYLAPIALLAKQGLRHFDLRDEYGAALALLTRDQNVRVAAAAMVSQAHAYLKQRHNRNLEEEIAIDLRSVAGSVDPPEEEFERLFRSEGKARVNRELLSRNPRLRALVGALAENFIVLVPLTATSRRVIKYAYDEPLPASRLPRSRRLLEAFGWVPAEILWSTPSVGLSRSFHLETEAPRDLEILGATLVATDSRGRSYVFRQGASGRRSHLNGDGMPQDAIGTASVSLRARRPGLLRAALVLALLTSILLSLGVWRIHAIESDPASPIALLALAPALLAAYLARPGEHELVSALLVGVRGLVVVVGASATGAAAVIMGGAGDHVARLILLALALTSWLMTGFLSLSYALPRPRRES
jgi:hypothetical protein